MTVFNDSSTGYSGVLPDDRNEARDDGLLNQYAHMYDVIKEDRYREKAVESESAERKAADATLQKNIENESGERKTADSEINAHIKTVQGNIDNVASDVEKINSVQPRNVPITPTAGRDSIAIGTNASSGGGSVTIGTYAKTSDSSVAIGTSTTAENGIAIGVSTTASGGIAVGRGASATSSNACAIGDNAKSTYSYSTAIGTGVTTTRTYEVSVGLPTVLRYVSNVKDPGQPQDAVTKSYLDNRISESLAAYLKTLPDIEYGYINVGTVGATSYVEKTITFASTKTEAPSVFVTPYVNANSIINAYVKTVSTTNAVIVIRNNTTTSLSNVTLDWLAISGR